MFYTDLQQERGGVVALHQMVDGLKELSEGDFKLCLLFAFVESTGESGTGDDLCLDGNPGL